MSKKKYNSIFVCGEESDFDTKIENFKRMIDESNKIVFFGGAGVSTESGIPDFRSADGLYNQHDINFDGMEPEYLLSRDCLRDKTKMFYEFYRQKLDCRNIEPNIAHKYLVKLEKQGKLSAIVTQNIDGLHQKAGSSQEKVLEIHGTTYKNYCIRCNKEYDKDYIFESKEPIPMCCSRTSLIRPAVTLYGEQLPEETVNKAVQAIKDCDLLIIAGTSLSVHPAASFVNYTNQNASIVLINRDKTMFDEYCDIVFREGIGDVISRLFPGTIIK